MSELQLLSLGYLLFGVLIVGEFLWSRLRRDGGYRVSQFVANVGHGMLFQVFDGFTKVLVGLPLVLLASLAPVALPMDAVWAWGLGLLVYDLAGYWRHRHHHEIAALWAIHGVHHAATDFNLAAALRQAVVQNTVSWLWYLPLVLFMPLQMLVIFVVFDYLYQFLQHTRYVPRLGPIGWVMNTPSHHRVHHGTEPKYIDRNYGGIFIIWDRLFGTFQPEEEEPTYGLTVPLEGVNPVWGNLALWVKLWQAARLKNGWVDRLVLVLGPPAEVERVDRDKPEDDGVSLAAGAVAYAGISFLGTPALLAALAWVPPEQLGLRVLLGLALVGGAVAPAAMLDGRRWGAAAEAVRLGLCVAAGVLALSGADLLLAGAVLVALVAAGVGGLVRALGHRERPHLSRESSFGA